MANNSDFEYAEQMAFDYGEKDKHPFLVYWFRRAIKRGRELAAAEAKPGLVWVKYDFVNAERWPSRSQQIVCVQYLDMSFEADFAANIYWPKVTHYAEITLPAEDK